MKIQKNQVNKLQERVLVWYEENKRDLPWRRTRDPYKILISEVMLQQTQVGRVIPKFEAWLERFPDVQSLADASVGDVLAAWSGLGYNRRALYLKKCAEVIVQKYHGEWPHEPEELEKLPGIGTYTARAVACFAFDKQVAVVDTNVRKVILVEFGKTFSKTPPHLSPLPRGEREMGEGEFTEKEIQRIADQLLPQGRAYDWNQALMDYASQMLAKEKIDIPKQSKFKGSNRYYRGQIIKLLLQEKSLPIAVLFRQVTNNYIEKDKDAIQKIVAGLQKDGLITIENGDVIIL